MKITKSIDVIIDVKKNLCNGCDFEGDSECYLFDSDLDKRLVSDTTYNVRCKKCLRIFQP